MQIKRIFRYLTLLALAFYLTGDSVFCQTQASHQNRKNTPKISARMPVEMMSKVAVPERPIVILFEDGRSARADLIQPDPKDTDAVIVEIEGVRQSIRLDEVSILQEPRKFDEYGDLRFNDEKARADNFAIQLQNELNSSGYIIAYGSCRGEGRVRAERVIDYLVNTRGIEAGRLVKVVGGCRRELVIELWISPPGATPPSASTRGLVRRCPRCQH